MPNNFLHVGLIHLILPNAKIIDARRSAMGCCFSGFKQLFAEEAGKVGTKIGEFVLDQASTSLLFARPLVTALAGSQPHNPDSSPRDAKRAPIRYVIQPKDTLGTVASKFKTSVDELVSNNRIRDRNKVFPGEVIWIYGPAPQGSTSGAAANSARLAAVTGDGVVDAPANRYPP